MSLSIWHFCLARVLDDEGGFVADPEDRGGPTNYGITEATLREARDRGIVHAGLDDLSQEEAGRIYRELYWRRCGCDRLPPAIAYSVFDFAVHSGPSVAVKALQRALRVDTDGVVGPETVAAAQRAGERTLGLLIAERLELVADLIARAFEQKRFRKGWFRRISEGAVFAGKLLAAQIDEDAA